MCVVLTQAAKLTDDGGERVVHHTLELAADAVGQLPPAEVTGLDVPLHQRHGEASHRHKLQRNEERALLYDNVMGKPAGHPPPTVDVHMTAEICHRAWRFVYLYITDIVI